MKIMFIMYSGNWKLNEVFKEYRPDIVYHAAAHKHVPSMGDALLRQLRTMYLVLKIPNQYYGDFEAYMRDIIQNLNDVSEAEFVAVRLGNVLGSNGSVIPLFKRQIKHG